MTFPFVFGGDGASFAVPPATRALARQALAETATWVKEDLDLSLRIGMISVADIRAHGLDVRVARYVPSENISIAMFSGGGIAWADAAMKRGEIAVPPAPPGAHPDLSGLSCRYEEIPASRGAGAVARGGAGPSARAPDAFRAAIEADHPHRRANARRVAPAAGPGLRLTWPPQGSTSRRAHRGAPANRSVARKIKVLALTFLYFLIMRLRHHGRPLHPGQIHATN